MTSGMNVNLRRSLTAVAALAFLAGPLRAEDYGGGGFDASQPSVLGEAAKAVVDRVFGVKGEAADIKYHAIELSNHSPLNAGIRSAIVPGWGQWFNRQPVKATALFIVVVGGAYGAVRLNHAANSAYDEYKSDGLKNGAKYDDYQRQQTQSALLGGAAVLLWGYSVWDAYHNAYNPLWSEARSVEIALLPDGAAVEWRKRF